MVTSGAGVWLVQVTLLNLIVQLTPVRLQLFVRKWTLTRVSSHFLPQSEPLQGQPEQLNSLKLQLFVKKYALTRVSSHFLPQSEPLQGQPVKLKAPLRCC